MSSQFTSSWLAARRLKEIPQSKVQQIRQAHFDIVELRTEEDLHEMIISWCRRQDPQIPFGHGRMDKKTGRTPGEPDFYLMLPGGRLLLIECKTETGDVSPDQKLFASSCKSVGHEVFIVRGYAAFLQLVREKML